MRIVIATVQVPFIAGGAEFLAKNLKAALERVGHRAEIVTVPFKDYPPEVITDQILACRLFDLTESSGNKIDLMIGLKFPAYFIRHPRKVLWVLHQHRPAYELWGTEYSDLHVSQLGRDVRQAIFKADNTFLGETKKIYTISHNVSSRLKKYNYLTSTPLYHPCPGAEKFRCEGNDNFILFPSRLTSIKRQHLAVEAMRYVKSPIKLYLVGRPDGPAYLESLRKVTSASGLDNKVHFLNSVSEEEKISLYANCRAVLFPPYEEDYGYITLEASYGSKPVLTCADSGGPLEFVEDGKTGFIRPPDPEQLAEAIDFLATREDVAREMGKKARKKIDKMNISWDNVVRELVRA